MQLPSKAVPESRDRLQSTLLVWVVGTIVTASCVPCFVLMTHPHNAGLSCLRAFGISLTFGILVWALRAATPAAAFFGSLICMILTLNIRALDFSMLHSFLSPLSLVFLLTFAATRLGKWRNPQLTAASERRHGRRASQIIANLGAAPLILTADFFGAFAHFAGPAALGGRLGDVTPVLVLAALAEATADTLSSELGQAFGGTPYLLTTMRAAPSGTDGAVSLVGTAAGLLGAAIVTAAGAWALQMDARHALTALTGATAGLLFDSLLGATVERRGWLNNDLVNFSSTAFAAAIALLLVALPS